MKKFKVSDLQTVPIIVGVILSTLINGIHVLGGGNAKINQFLNFYSQNAWAQHPSYLSVMMLLFAVACMVCAVLLTVGLVKFEFLPGRASPLLKWGLFSAIVGILFYGFSTRLISNHQAAANLYYFFGLLYFLLWYVERRSSQNTRVFDKVKTLPIFVLMMYTMGLPGFNKLINADTVMPVYVNMFKDSILAKTPGGVKPMMYFLGVCESVVPLLLLVGLVRKEFFPATDKKFFELGAMLNIATFIMLSFGMTVILNFPGTTNLIFYAIFTLGLYRYAMTSHSAAPVKLPEKEVTKPRSAIACM